MNVTENFRQQASTLKSGELIKHKDFTLLESISAFELGNPKMDTGMTWIPFSQSLKLGLPQTEQDCLEAMDALFCREMAWLQGSTLVQTVFSALYVESELQTLNAPNTNAVEYIKSLKSIDPKPDLILSVYVLATLKACSLVIEQIFLDRSDVVALEEDFHAGTGGWSLLEGVPIDVVVSLVDWARQSCKQLGMLQFVPRLEMRSEWLFVVKQGLTKKHAHLNRVLELAQAIDLSTPSEGTLAQFSTAVQARSDGVCLSRPLVGAQPNESREFFLATVNHIKACSALLSLTDSAQVLGFFLNFGKAQHTTLVRILVKNVFRQYDLLGASAANWVERDVTEMSFPGFAAVKPKIIKQCREAWQVFITQAPLCYFDFLTLMCMNRCRQRQVLFECIAGWDSLHVAAQNLDRAIVEAGLGERLGGPADTKQWACQFSAWVAQRKLQMMLWATLMGLEQDLYSLHERGAIYWYAGRLATMLVDQLGRLKLYFEQRSLRSKTSYQYIHAMDVESRCMEHLCAANTLVFWLLEKRGLIKPPQTEYTTRALTFGLRLECFEAVGIPPVPPYSMYEQEMAKFDEDLAINAAKSHLSGALAFLKTITQQTGEMEELGLLKRSAFGLSATILKLQKSATGKISIATDCHWSFGVPTLN